MKKFLVKHVNAFTDQPFSGNPAGVVLDARGLTEARMQIIAREMGMPETAFVLPPTWRGANLQIRWFTPTVEVPLCGHATIGAFHALAEEETAGMRHNGTHHFKVQTKSGLLSVDVEKKHSASVIEFHMPVMKFRPIRVTPPKLAKALGLTRAMLHRRLPVARGNYIYVPVRSLSMLRSLSPDMNALAAFCKASKLVGVCVLSLQTVDEGSAVHSRFFAPAAGVPEDPVTGSANGPLGIYLYQFALRQGIAVPSLSLPDGRLEFIGEQGDSLGRKGRVTIRVRLRKGVVDDISVGGQAVTIFTTQLQS